jgi:putative flippase GtrA
MARTGLASVLTTGVEYGLYLGLIELLGVLYLYSALFASIAGLALNFSLNRFWVFRDAENGPLSQLGRYLFSTGVGMGAGLLTLYTLVAVATVPYRLAWIVANLTLFTLWTYPANRYLVFPGRRSA